jgi:hypothetical protein
VRSNRTGLVGVRQLLVAFAVPGLLASASVSALQCNVYDPSLLDPVDPGVEPKDGVGWWSGAGDRGCFSAKEPSVTDRPGPQGDGDVGPIYLALQSMRIGSLNLDNQLDSNAWQDLGYDLDGVCTGSDTCEGADTPPSCKPTVPQIATDGHFCRDNTFGRLEYAAALIPELSNTYGLNDDQFNCALCVGDYNFVIRITGYNGEPNDDRIRIDLYPSPGLEKPLPWDCSKPDWRTHPCFTTDLQWTIQKDALVEPHDGPDLSDSKIADPAAFVKDGYIVAQLPPDTLFWFPGYKALVVAFPLRVQRATVSAKLGRGPDGVWRLTDGIIGGRTKGADIVEGFRLMGFCETDQNYSVMTDFVNKNLDVSADGANDPETTCDAMSVGLSFTALQAVAGKTATVEPLEECVRRGTTVDDAGADASKD